MSNHSVPYFLNLYNSVANDNCKVFFDFNQTGVGIINTSGLGLQVSGEIISNLDNFWSNSGSGFFSGNSVKIKNVESGINILDSTYVIVYENLASGGAALLSTINTGNGISGLYYKGYEFGFTANNVLYFEYYTNNGPQVFTSNYALSDKGCVYLTVANNKVSFGSYNYFYSEFNSNNFLIDSNYLFDADNIFIGYNSDVINTYSYNKRFTGYMEQFLAFSPSIYTNDVLYLSSGFAHTYTPDTIYIEQTIINQITGYSTGITGYYTGVTGYSIVATGVEVDDFGIQYTGYSELQLTGTQYGTGIIALSGETIIESTGYSGAYISLNNSFIRSFAKSNINILKNIKEKEFIDISVPSGNYNYAYRVNLNGQYNYVENSFFNNYISDRNYFFNVFKNGLVKISGVNIISGDVYNVQNIISNDYVLNSRNAVLFTGSSNVDDNVLFDSIQSYYNTGFYIKNFNLNMPNYYYNSGSGVILQWPTTGNRLFFGGRKMISGNIQNIGINCDYAVTESGFFFHKNTGIFSTNTGDLLLLPNIFNNNITGTSNVNFIIDKYPSAYSEVYLAGRRLNINKDYLELASFDANAGSGIFDINTDILYNNNILF